MAKMDELYSTANVNFTIDLNVDFITMLDRIRKKSLNDIQRTTIYGGYMVSYYEDENEITKRGLLNFIQLQSMRYTGMTMLNLVAQVRELFGCSSRDLMNYTLIAPTLASWEAYWNIARQYLKPTDETNKKTGPQEYWKYAREFQRTVFSELSFQDNTSLCQILAIILDYQNDPNISVYAPGEVLQGIQGLRTKCP